MIPSTLNQTSSGSMSSDCFKSAVSFLNLPSVSIKITCRNADWSEEVLRKGGNSKIQIVALIFAVSQATLHPMDWKNRITLDPEKRGGKPCIRGLRMTVYDVLEYLASGMSEEEILKDFPDLTREDIRACLAFAADRERKLVSIPPS